MNAQPHRSISSINESIYDLVSNIKPLDDIESEHIQSTLQWIQSGDPLYRITKPDIPNKHLVAYFVLYDKDASKILLVDHKKAQLWLPTGGHVEVDEHPRDTVIRECFEELGIHADFWLESPLFLTSTMTVGLTAGHTDVSLWYVLRGKDQHNYSFDIEEFNSIRWFHIDEVETQKTDPHMSRFVRKLRKF
jgi:8-oxo-dGTP pyrophosphatase MutT (NUDIX family)